MRSSGFKFQTSARRRMPWLPDGGPDFLSSPLRGCAPEKVGDPDWFFPDNAAGRARAIEICKTACPFRRICDEYATERREKWGVWGGRCRDPRLVPIDDQQVHELWRRGLSSEEIAVEIGTTPRAVVMSRNRQGLSAA